MIDQNTAPSRGRGGSARFGGKQKREAEHTNTGLNTQETQSWECKVYDTTRFILQTNHIAGIKLLHYYDKRILDAQLCCTFEFGNVFFLS